MAMATASLRVGLAALPLAPMLDVGLDSRVSVAGVGPCRSPLRSISIGARKMKRSPMARATSEGRPPTTQATGVPLWLWMLRSMYSGVRNSVHFLWEQPGQLQHIEWPSFQSTARMAMLTLIVVAFLIVFLATIDSTFSYVLASLLRRVP